MAASRKVDNVAKLKPNWIHIDLKPVDSAVSDEGIPVILVLIDQLHGLRRTLRDLLSAIHAQPEAMRRWIVADLRAAVLDRTDGAAQEGPGSDEHQER